MSRFIKRNTLNTAGPDGITAFDHEYRLSSTQRENVI